MRRLVATSLVSLALLAGSRSGGGHRAVPVAAQDATTQVQIIDFGFDAAAVEIPVGSSVTWLHAGAAPHTTTALLAPNSANAGTDANDSHTSTRAASRRRSTRCDQNGPATVRARVCAAITIATSRSRRPQASCSHTGKNCM